MCEWWGYTIIVLSALGSVLAWVAKIYWAKEHKRATDAHIRNLESEIKHREAKIKSISEEFERYKEDYSFDRIIQYYKKYKDELEKILDKVEDELLIAKHKLAKYEVSEEVGRGEINAMKSEIRISEEHELNYRNLLDLLNAEVPRLIDTNEVKNLDLTH